MVFILFQINHIIFCNGPYRYLYDKLGHYRIVMSDIGWGGEQTTIYKGVETFP